MKGKPPLERQLCNLGPLLIQDCLKEKDSIYWIISFTSFSPTHTLQVCPQIFSDSPSSNLLS